MSKGRDRIVSRRPDGTWENKRNENLENLGSTLHFTLKNPCLVLSAQVAEGRKEAVAKASS